MNTPENTPIRSQKPLGRILAPNTQIPEHRRPRISRQKEVTVIPDTPDRDPDSQQDFENVAIDRVLDTPSPASQTPVGARGRQPFNFSLSFSLNDTPGDQLDETPSNLEMESTKVKSSNRRKSYLIDSKSTKIKRRSSTKQLLRQLDNRPIRRTPDLVNMFEETGSENITGSGSKQTDFSFQSPERSPQMSQTQQRTISMIADSPGPVASVLFPKNEPPIKRQEKVSKKVPVPEVHVPEVSSEEESQPEVREITEKTSRIALKGRRRTRLSLEACSTPPAVNYGHVGLKDSSYILVNFNEKERKELNSAIYKLSNGCKNFKLVQNAKCHTTHCFIKGKSKTVQIYKSLAYGAYILTAEFVKDSLAAGHWVSAIEILNFK